MMQRLERIIERFLNNECGGDEERMGRVLDKLGALLEEEEAQGTDARFRGGPGEGAERWDHRLIADHIPNGSSVLDLGCGSGTLLAHLMEEKGIRAQGIEIDSELVMQCVANGVPVFQTNLDEGLAGFPDRSFDYVVLEETVQTLHKPVTVLQEMVRVGRRGIVSFPNFGFWKVRLYLSAHGRMPKTEAWPYEWFDSPNIHPLTVRDFEALLDDMGIHVADGHVWAEGGPRRLGEDDNVFAEQVMLIVEKG